MGKKRTSPAASSGPAMTFERAARLYFLLQLLDAGPQRREELVQRLGQGVRGFYRALESLRDLGIAVALEGGRYSLPGDVTAAADRLPFPIATLTFGAARQLARGRTAAHRSLAAQLTAFENWQPKKPRARRKS